MRRGDPRISVRLDDELARRFRSYQEAHSLSESDAARTLLALALSHGHDPVARAALAIQSRVCAELGRHHHEMERKVLAAIRQLVPEGT